MAGFGRWFDPRLPTATRAEAAKSAEIPHITASCCHSRVPCAGTRVPAAIFKLRRDSVLSPRARPHLRPPSRPHKTGNCELLHVYCSRHPKVAARAASALTGGLAYVRPDSASEGTGGTWERPEAKTPAQCPEKLSHPRGWPLSTPCAPKAGPKAQWPQPGEAPVNALRTQTSPVRVSRPRRAIAELGLRGTQRPPGRSRNRPAAPPAGKSSRLFRPLWRSGVREFRGSEA
jgi:hypothetical protein